MDAKRDQGIEKVWNGCKTAAKDGTAVLIYSSTLGSKAPLCAMAILCRAGYAKEKAIAEIEKVWKPTRVRNTSNRQRRIDNILSEGFKWLDTQCVNKKAESQRSSSKSSSREADWRAQTTSSSSSHKSNSSVRARVRSRSQQWNSAAQSTQSVASTTKEAESQPPASSNSSRRQAESRLGAQPSNSAIRPTTPMCSKTRFCQKNPCKECGRWTCRCKRYWCEVKSSSSSSRRQAESRLRSQPSNSAIRQTTPKCSKTRFC